MTASACLRGSRLRAHGLQQPELLEEIAEKGLAGLFDDGCAELNGTVLVIPNFIDAQEASQSDAQRKREQRERDRSRSRSAVVIGGAPEPVGTVYFVRAVSGGPVKIGFTDGRIADRLSSIQTGHPERLRVLAAFPATIEVERELHARFAAHRGNGEWFEWANDIAEYVTNRGTYVTASDASVTSVTPRSQVVTSGHSVPSVPSVPSDPIPPTPLKSGGLISGLDQIWGAAGLPGLPAAGALEPLASALAELKLDPLEACKAFKAISAGWSRGGRHAKLNPAKMLDALPLIHQALRGELDPETIGRSPRDPPPEKPYRPDGEDMAEMVRKLGIL